MIARRLLTLLAALIVSVAACNSPSKDPGTSVRKVAVDEEKQALVPLPPREKLDARRVALGRKLFDDKILSGDQAVACSSCHLRDKGLSNGKKNADLAARPVGPAGALNVPTLYNVRYNYLFNWDGRFDSLEAQLDALMERPGAMGVTWAKLVVRLIGHSEYAPMFRDAFPDGVTGVNIRSALVEYINSLTTQGSRFDREREGDPNALSPDEKKGFLLFQTYGCSACHQGVNIGGGMRARFGVSQGPVTEGGITEGYFRKRGTPVVDVDRGYWVVTHDPEDLYTFRVPSLRNVALTKPYFHDGSAESLEDAVRAMGEMQLGRTLEAWEVYQLVAFLQSLTGDVPDEGTP